MIENQNFYRSKLGEPGSGKSEVSQGGYAKLVLPAAINDYLDAVVTYVESWSTIYVQLPSAYHILSSMQKQFQQQYLTTEPLPNPTPGLAGILKYGLQNVCYRVLVMERIDPTEILVRFVDFGYMDVVTNQLIHPISQELINLPAQAFAVQMKLKHSLTGSMSFDAFQEYMRNAQVVIQLVGQTVNNSFSGIVHVLDVNNESHRISEAIESKLPIKRSIEKPDKEVRGTLPPNDFQEPLELYDNEGENIARSYSISDQEYAPDFVDYTEDARNQNVENKFMKAEKLNADEYMDQHLRARANDVNQERNLLERKEKLDSSRPFRKQTISSSSSTKVRSDHVNQLQHGIAPANPSINDTFHRLSVAHRPSDSYHTSNGDASTQFTGQLIWMVFVSLVVAAVLTSCFIFAAVFTRKWKRILNPNIVKNGKGKKQETELSKKNDAYPIPLKHHSRSNSSFGTSAHSETVLDKNQPAVIDKTTPDNLTPEELSSVLGLMAIGNLKNDIDTNLKNKYGKHQQKRLYRKHAGRSVVAYDMSQEHAKNIEDGGTPHSMATKKYRHGNLKNDHSKEKCSITSKQLESESTENCKNPRASSTDDVESISDESESEEVDEPGNGSNEERQKKEIVINISTSPSKSISTNYTSAVPEHGVQRKGNTERGKKRWMNEENATIPHELPRTWIRDDATTMEKNTVINFNNIQQNIDNNQNQPQRTFSVWQTSSAHHETPIHSRLNHSNEESNTHPYAYSIHSSDFEIPSYLNVIPPSNQSHQSIHRPSKSWICSQQNKHIKSITKPQVKNQTWIQSDITEDNNTTALKQINEKDKIHLEKPQNTRVMSTSYVNDISQKVNRTMLVPSRMWSLREMQQIDTESASSAWNQTNRLEKDDIFTEAKVESRAIYNSLLSSRCSQGSNRLDEAESNKSQQSIGPYLVNGNEMLNSSISTQFCETDSHSSFRKEEAGNISPVEEMFKMKMRIALAPSQRHKSPPPIHRSTTTEYTEENTERVISDESTTYESTRDLSADTL